MNALVRGDARHEVIVFVPLGQVCEEQHVVLDIPQLLRQFSEDALVLAHEFQVFKQALPLA